MQICIHLNVDTWEKYLCLQITPVGKFGHSFRWGMFNMTILTCDVGSGGFFGLSNMLRFCTTKLDPLVGNIVDDFVLDFSRVRLWDHSVLLWLAIGLQHYRREGLRFRIRLPESVAGSDPSAERSGDFLRRWAFNVALCHVGELATVLVSDQADYFVGGPRRFYIEGSTTMTDDYGVQSKLISNRLVEIRDLTRESAAERGRVVCDKEIQACIRDFQDARIGNVLFNNCSSSKNEADCFADHLITESLLNLKQHPNASTGLLTVGVLGRSKELILCIADNGDSIVRTILPVFTKDHEIELKDEMLQDLPLKTRSEILHFATKPYVTSKPLETNQEIGLGLTYIKQDTINRFNGKLRIISESVQAIYQEDSEAKPLVKEWRHGWGGNLLRISIPLKSGKF